ncbi:helix-turn-helix domain-containing protein [Pseudomonas cichorii]|uniref:helix-turn-helix domain-containing protein n=1 Tax=Pseudomonas cichorii TaxID=36746 RepID=UPI003907FE3C
MSMYERIPNDLITATEAAEVLGVSLNTLKTWRTRNPNLGYFRRHNRDIRYSRKECQQYYRRSFQRVVPGSGSQ